METDEEKEAIKNIFKIGYMANEKYEGIDEDKAFEKWQREMKIDIDIPHDRIKKAFVSGYRTAGVGFPFAYGWAQFIKPYAFEFLHQGWVFEGEKYEYLAKYLILLGREHMLERSFYFGWSFGETEGREHNEKWDEWVNFNWEQEKDGFIDDDRARFSEEELKDVLERFFSWGVGWGWTYRGKPEGKEWKIPLAENLLGMCLDAGSIVFVEDDVPDLTKTMLPTDAGEYQQIYRAFQNELFIREMKKRKLDDEQGNG